MNREQLRKQYKDLLAEKKKLQQERRESGKLYIDPRIVEINDKLHRISLLVHPPRPKGI